MKGRAGAATALGLFAVAAAFLWAGGVNTRDETWFLQVLDRVAGGESLYADVDYSPLPLAVWLGWGAVAAVGTHVFVVKALVAACWAATAIFTGLAVRRLGGTGVAAGIAVLGLVAVSPPRPQSLYNPLAAALLVACLWASLRFAARPGTRDAGLAGGLAGTAFAAKQSIGALALIAVLLTVLALRGRPPGGRPRAATAVVGAFGAVTAAVLVPVLLTGGLSELVEAGFLPGDPYLSSGSIGYSETLRDSLAAAPARLGSTLPTILMPVIAVLALAAWLARARPPLATATALAGFAAAGVAGAFPRVDVPHLAWAAPPLVVAVAAAWATTPRFRGADLLAAAVVAIAASAGLYAAVAPLVRGERVRSALAAVEPAPIDRPSEEWGARFASAAGRDGENRRLFVVMPQAGLLYLATGIENPTRFDYPAASAVGPDDVAGLADAIDRGELTRACIGGPDWYAEEPELWPAALVRMLERRLTHVGKLGICELWARR